MIVEQEKRSFSDLVEGIQAYRHTFPADENEEKLYSHRFSFLQEAQEKNYLFHGKRIYDLFKEAIERKYPLLLEYEDSIIVLCEGIAGYLEKPCALLATTQSKAIKDYFIQKIISPDERALLDNSITQRANIRRIYKAIEGAFHPEIPPKEFHQLMKDTQRYYQVQGGQKDDVLRVLHARNVQKLVRDFCITFIKH